MPLFLQYLLGSAPPDSTWFQSFSITVEYHLNVDGIVTAKQPESPVKSFVWDINTTQCGDGVPDARSMALCHTRSKEERQRKPVDTLDTHSVGFDAISLVAKFQKSCI